MITMKENNINIKNPSRIGLRLLRMFGWMLPTNVSEDSIPFKDGVSIES